MSVARHAIDEAASEPAPPVTPRLRLQLAERPRVRGECIDGPRPCPWTRCRHHLANDIDERTGRPRFVLKRDPATMKETCSLDVADRGGATLEELGDILDLTRERIRQMQVAALVSLVLQMYGRGLMSLAEAAAAMDVAQSGILNPRDIGG